MLWGRDPAVQGGVEYPAVWGIFQCYLGGVCSFCWGESARLTHQKTSTPQCTFLFKMLGGGSRSSGGGDPAVWGIFSWEARVFSFCCWGEPARLTHSPKDRHLFFVFWWVSWFIFCCYLGEALRVGVRGFTEDDFIFDPRIPALKAFPR